LSETTGLDWRPRVSVVIVNWNTLEMLRRCLASLAADVECGLCEIIAVDNGSHDGSPEMVKSEFPSVTLVENAENRGFGPATNQGFEHARGDYVLMLNSDTIVEEGALASTAACLDAQPEVAVAGCRIVYPSGEAQSSCFRFPSVWTVLLNALHLAQSFPNSPVLNRVRYGFAIWHELRDVDCVMGSFMMLRREAIEELPLLDEGYFMYGEELDLCYRLKSAGWRVVYFPDATTVHHHGGSSPDPRHAAWAYEANQRATLRFLRKWRGVPIAWLANLVMLVGLVPRSIGWLAVDLLGGLSAGSPPGLDRALKARAIRFHLAALVRPSRFDSSWALEPRT
jgi:GT2 family glycosyltransferase